MPQCNICQKDFHAQDMTTLSIENHTKVCKVCKIKHLQGVNRQENIIRAGGRRRDEKITIEQEEYIRANYKKISVKNMAFSLSLKIHTITYFLKVNDLRKNNSCKRDNN